MSIEAQDLKTGLRYSLFPTLIIDCSSLTAPNTQLYFNTKSLDILRYAGIGSFNPVLHALRL